MKPARLGSSVGISKVHDASELGPAVELARRHDEKVLVEEFVAGVEVECGVLGNQRPAPIASVVGEIVPHAEWYDYAAKYDEGGSDIIVPARIPDEVAARVQEVAVEAFVATECEGMARVDFFVREGGEVVVNELNTIPGFTSTSVYAKLFAASGIPYRELLDRLVELALERHERRRSLEYWELARTDAAPDSSRSPRPCRDLLDAGAALRELRDPQHHVAAPRRRPAGTRSRHRPPAPATRRHRTGPRPSPQSGSLQ